jgi:hypothetical protein
MLSFAIVNLRKPLNPNIKLLTLSVKNAVKNSRADNYKDIVPNWFGLVLN